MHIDDQLNLVLSLETKRKLAAAADAKHQSIPEFVFDSAMKAADETLIEQRTLSLNSPDWQDFLAALDAPPSRHPRLERLLREPSIFD